jgi:hypothetical protein
MNRFLAVFGPSPLDNALFAAKVAREVAFRGGKHGFLDVSPQIR